MGEPEEKVTGAGDLFIDYEEIGLLTAIGIL
jgi:hypothetical protein